jgi:hypothetical protein
MGAPHIANPLKNPLATLADVVTLGQLHPDLPTPAAVTEVPTAENQNARLEAKMREAAQRQGRASTILSGRSDTMLPSASQTLMGGG